MPRIRVGLVGLSTSSIQAQWAAKANLPYLQSAHGQERYELVALCNTSHASAKRSIEEYKLPSSTKTYDSPEALAADSDVDLIVNVTGVDKHHEVLMPALQAGRKVFTELPLASNMAQMQELMDTLGKANNVDNVFGMQGQTHPVPKLVKEILAQGKIGKVLSSTWTGAAGAYFGGGPVPVGVKAFTDRQVGANFLTVLFLHTVNYVMSTLGEVETFQSILGNQRPKVDLIDPNKDGKLVETVQKDTPDQILFQGRFESGALFSYHLRGGEPFPGDKGLVWSIYGEKGEIRITNPVCMMDIMHAGVEIKLQVAGKDEVETIELPKDELSDLPHPAQNVGRIYAAYADGKKGGEGRYPDWKVGMRRHQLLEAMWKQSDSSSPFGMPFYTRYPQ